MRLDIVKYEDGYLGVHKIADEKWLGRYYNAQEETVFQHEWSSLKIDKSIHWLIVMASGEWSDRWHLPKLLLTVNNLPLQVEVDDKNLTVIHQFNKVDKWHKMTLGEDSGAVLIFLELLDLYGITPDRIKVDWGTVYYYHDQKINII